MRWPLASGCPDHWKTRAPRYWPPSRTPSKRQAAEPPAPTLLLDHMRRNPQDENGPSGVLLIDKAEDMTSHDVVAIARRALNTKKIGHCGTLDPMATGLLMLVIGRATKIQDLLMSEDKQYVGTLTLGATTSTQDRQGEILESLPVENFTKEQIHQAFDGFVGDLEQIPPMVSAIKKDGVPL